MSILNYNQGPIKFLDVAVSGANKPVFAVKREDLNHSFVSGNKWWKLKYNLEAAKNSLAGTVLTFGGPYSNHLYATAAACREAGIKSIGIVRGDEARPLNATLTFARECGMQLYFVSREEYRKKTEPEFLKSWRNRIGEFYLIPEGGTNRLAVKGCEEWARGLKNEINFDYVCLPVGTGGTIAGVVNSLPDKKVVGFSALKGGEFLIDEVKQWINHEETNWLIETGYHFGGYGKATDDLQEFILEFEKTHSIPLDPVYTGKMMWGVFDLLKKNFFAEGSTVLILHSGGLQGRSGFNF